MPLSDVRQAEQLLYTATSEIPQLEEQIQQQENAIAFLLGENPGPIAHRDPNALAPPPQDLPTGLPSQLLERRPDIQQAEAHTHRRQRADRRRSRAVLSQSFHQRLQPASAETASRASSTPPERPSTASAR